MHVACSQPRCSQIHGTVMDAIAQNRMVRSARDSATGQCGALRFQVHLRVYMWPGCWMTCYQAWLRASTAVGFGSPPQEERAEHWRGAIGGGPAGHQPQCPGAKSGTAQKQRTQRAVTHRALRIGRTCWAKLHGPGIRAPDDYTRMWYAIRQGV